MKQAKDFKAIIDSVKSTFMFITRIANDKEEKASVYKILKNYAKLPFSVRKVLMPSMISVSGNFLIYHLF